MSDAAALTGPWGHPAGVNCSAVDAVMNHSSATGAQRLVLLAIARFVNAQTREAYPSNETIRRLAGCGDVSTVKRAITGLIASGELERDVQASPLGTNVYRLPKLEGWGGSPPEQHSQSLVAFASNEDFYEHLRSSRGEAPPVGGSATALLAQQLSYEFADALIAAGRKKPKFRDDAASNEWFGAFDQLVFEHFPRCSVECLRAVAQRAADPLPDGTLIHVPGDLLGNNWRTLEQEWRDAHQAPQPPHETVVRDQVADEERRKYYASLTGRHVDGNDWHDSPGVEAAAMTEPGAS